MLLPTKLLFELSVYRVDEASYFRDFDKYKAKNNHIPEHSPIHIESFGGQWEYNEIIGFLKFYVSGNTQIRVEYTETNTIKKSKNPEKCF